MKTLFGYPLQISASVEVDGEPVDISEAFVFDAATPSGLRIDYDKVLDVIGAAQEAQQAGVRAQMALLTEIVLGPPQGPCDPKNGGIAGIRPYCYSCGCMTQPPVPCGRDDCEHRPLGATDGVGWPD